MNNKYWSVLFLLVPVLGVGLFVYAPLADWWLPQDVSTYGHRIDRLFYIILGITGVVFVGVQGLFVYFIYKYRSDEPGRAKYVHGHHTLELVWSIVPAGILVFIAVAQMSTWADIKFRKRMPAGEPLAEVMARQFEWQIRYPGPDGKLGTIDDIFAVNDFHVPVDQPIKIALKTSDVLHSFFVPEFRVKQDAVPGLTIPVWFEVTKTGQYELMCAELCGWGHYKMRGRVTVQTPEEFKAWLAKQKAEQDQDQADEPERIQQTEVSRRSQIETVAGELDQKDEL